MLYLYNSSLSKRGNYFIICCFMERNRIRMTVLDIGCGPGFFTREIAKMLNGTGKVIDANIQEGMLKIS